MGIFAFPIRLLITGSLMISLSGAGIVSCLVAPACVPQRESARATQCCCGCGSADGQACQMGCCREKTPAQQDRELPKRGERDQRQLVLAFAELVSPSVDAVDHGSSITLLFAALTSRLAPPTLQSQHICMQV